MKTAQEQDIHCGTCTVKGDMLACLATPCSVRSSWFANSQSQEIERLKAELHRAKQDPMFTSVKPAKNYAHQLFDRNPRDASMNHDQAYPHQDRQVTQPYAHSAVLVEGEK